MENVQIQQLMNTAFKRKESYTSLSLLKQCPYRYYLHYIQKQHADTKSIALEIGNLCHKIMENKYLGLNIDLQKEIYSGYPDNEEIKGIDEIQKEYFDEWMIEGRKSGLSYEEKINIFKKKIDEPINDKGWTTIGCEVPFEIEYGGITIVGKIDRIDKNKNGDYKVTDYKTSDAVYSERDLKTPLQMLIYALAIKNMYGCYPIDFEYDFLLLDKKAKAMTDDKSIERGLKLLDKIIILRNKLYKDRTGELFEPKASPLCYWCDYCCNGDKKDDKVKCLCDYYSLWTPNNKTFSVNKKYEIGLRKNEEEEFIW